MTIGTEPEGKRHGFRIEFKFCNPEDGHASDW